MACTYKYNVTNKNESAWGRKMKYVVYAFMICVFIDAVNSGQNILTCLCAPAMIYGVYYLVRKAKNKKPPEGTEAAVFREMADAPGVKENAKKRAQAQLDQEIDSTVDAILSGARMAAQDGKREYTHRYVQERVMKGTLKELRRRGFTATSFVSSLSDYGYESYITVKW